MTTFADLGLKEATLKGLADVGYEKPSPIQEQAIPAMLGGQDVIGQAQTGSGKTAAFGLPIVEYVDTSLQEVQALVLTPTRELCIQVTQAIRSYGAPHGVDVVAVFGGAPIKTQQAQLKNGGHVVVGTVGRVLDLISRHSLVLHDCRFVVLDEADEMLDLGFLDDVAKILSLTPNSRQTALFSATMAPPIRKLADNYLYDPVHVKVQSATLTVDTVSQYQVPVNQKDKPAKLVEVLQAEKPDQAIVFVRTKIRCDQLYRTLRDKGMNVKALHGDMSQGSRDGVMLGFKGGRVPILVATDVAARGLDISTVTHVINYDAPKPDVYVHRIGRTGRAGRAGRAVTFVEPKQVEDLEAIEAHISHKIGPWSAGVASVVQDVDGKVTDVQEPTADAATEAPAAEETEAKPKRTRTRRRAKAVEEETPAETVEAAEAEAEVSPAPDSEAPAVEEEAPVEEQAPVEAEAEVAEEEAPKRRPRRHTKPKLTPHGDQPPVTLVAGVGSADGIEVRDVVRHIVKSTGLDGEVVQDVRVLTRFTLLKVPGAEVDRVLSEVDGSELAGAPLRLQRAAG